VSAAGAVRAPRGARAAAAAPWIAAAAFLLYAATGGGRIVGSDEITMLEVARAFLHGHVDVPVGATLDGPGGRHYSKNTAGQAIAALPLVALGEAAASAARLSPGRHALAVRFVASFFNAIVAALLLACFYVVARRMRVSARVALVTALLLGFTTPLWVYAKSFMAEPLQALGLLLLLAGLAGVFDEGPAAAPAPAPSARSQWAAFLGAFIAISAKLSMLPIAAFSIFAAFGRPRRAWIAPALGLAAALAGHALYNVARFHTPFETGYGAQATSAGFTTPWWVGLYGLVISSGKGVLWFAPVLWVVFAALRVTADPGGLPLEASRMREWYRSRRPADRVRLGAWMALYGALSLYSRFQHWAGDGSFGPRYLLPVVPLLFLVVAIALERGPRPLRRWAVVLGLCGLLVQIGGVAIYFGAQMRDAGDYPYTLPLDHPRFMSDSHFNPRYTPILGHWRLLLRNTGEHLRGEMPRLTVGGGAGAGPGAGVENAAPSGEATAAERLGVGEEDQQKLLHALDFWWLYLAYAGFPLLPGLLAATALKLAGLWAAWRAWRAARAEDAEDVVAAIAPREAAP